MFSQYGSSASIPITVIVQFPPNMQDITSDQFEDLFGKYRRMNTNWNKHFPLSEPDQDAITNVDQHLFNAFQTIVNDLASDLTSMTHFVFGQFV